MMPEASSFCRRSARMLVAMPSPACWNSLNVRWPRTIMSRTMSSDQRSPKISREMLTGQPDRRLGLGRFCTLDTLSNIACSVQVIFCNGEGQSRSPRDDNKRDQLRAGDTFERDWEGAGNSQPGWTHLTH